jgi:hypothetical protein
MGMGMGCKAHLFDVFCIGHVSCDYVQVFAGDRLACLDFSATPRRYDNLRGGANESSHFFAVIDGLV